MLDDQVIKTPTYDSTESQKEEIKSLDDQISMHKRSLRETNAQISMLKSFICNKKTIMPTKPSPMPPNTIIQIEFGAKKVLSEANISIMDNKEKKCKVETNYSNASDQAISIKKSELILLHAELLSWRNECRELEIKKRLTKSMKDY